MINSCVYEGRLVSPGNYHIFHNNQTGRDTPSWLFTIAVPRNFKNRNGQRESDFFNCRMSGRGANVIHQIAGVGDTLVVSGEMHNDNYRSNRYQDNNGNPAIMRSLQMTVFDANLAGRSRKNQAQGMPEPNQGSQMNQPSPNNYQMNNNPVPQTNPQINNQPNQPAPRMNNPRPANNGNQTNGNSFNNPNRTDPFKAGKNKGINISDKDLPF